MVLAGARPEPEVPRTDKQSAQSQRRSVSQAKEGLGRRALDDASGKAFQVLIYAPPDRVITDEDMALVRKSVANTNRAYGSETKGMQLRLVPPNWADVHNLEKDIDDAIEETQALFEAPIAERMKQNPDIMYYVYYFGSVAGAVGFTLPNRMAALVVDDHAFGTPNYFGHGMSSEGANSTNLHEIIAHQLGYTDKAQAACNGAVETGGGLHLLDRRDVVYFKELKNVKVHIDPGHDNYFSHGNPDCPDLEKDVYTKGPARIEAEFDQVAEKAWKLGVDFGERLTSTYRANGGWVREYEDVVITHNEKYGTHVIKGEILQQWRGHGGVRKLGHAMGDETRTTVDGKKGLTQGFSRHASTISVEDPSAPLDLTKELRPDAKTYTFTFGPQAPDRPLPQTLTQASCTVSMSV